MTPTIRAHPVDDVSAATRIRHYDELPEGAKERLPAIVSGETPVVSSDIASTFQSGEIVKFTRYYRIEIVDDPVRVRADSGS